MRRRDRRRLTRVKAHEAARTGRWQARDESVGAGLMEYAGGVAGAMGGNPNVEVRSIGPTDADRTFFQSIRLKLANNPLERPFSQHPIIYACAHAIAANMCDTKWLIRPSTQEKAPPVKNEFSELFSDPNPLMSEADFFYLISVYLSTSGEALVIKEGKEGRVENAAEMPAELWPLNGKLFRQVIDPRTRLVAKWILNPDSPDAIEYAPHEVIQVRYPNPYDPYRGLAPMEAARQAVMTDWQQILYNEAYFRNGCDPGGIISTERPLTPTQQTEIEEKIESRHAGSNKQKRLMVLAQGVKYESLSQSHKDMEFEAGRKFNREEILAAFRMPPAEAGFYEDVNYATAMVEARRFWTRTMFPIFRIVEDAFRTGLFRMVLGGRYVGKFDRDGIPEIQQALTEQIDSAKKLTELGFSAAQAIKKVGLDIPTNPWQDRAWTGQGAAMIDMGTLDAGAAATEESEVAVPSPKTLPTGPQITSALSIVQQVNAGALKPEQGLAMLIQFLGIEREQAAEMIGIAADESTTPALPSGLPMPAATEAAQEASAAPAGPPGKAADVLEMPVPITERPGHARRRAYWKTLHAEHYGPQEAKFRGMVKRVFSSMRAEQMRLVDAHPKAFGNGKVLLLISEKDATEIRQWSAAVRRVKGTWLHRADDEKLRRRTLAVLHTKAPKALDAMLFDSAKWRKAIGEASRPHYKRVVMQSAERLAKSIGRATPWAADSPAVEKLTTTLASRITDVTETVRSRLREVLGDVVSEGGGVREAQDVVRQVFKVSLARSLTIARTEVGGASNRANFIAAGEMGVERLEWVSAQDEFVREEHRIDGEVVDIGEKFSNDLRFPHDPDGDADEVINCRCDCAPADSVEGDEDPDNSNVDYGDEADVEEKAATKQYRDDVRKLRLEERRARIDRLRAVRPTPAPIERKIEVHAHIAPPNVSLKNGDIHAHLPSVPPTPIAIEVKPTPIEVKSEIHVAAPETKTGDIHVHVDPTPLQVDVHHQAGDIHVHHPTAKSGDKVTEFIRDKHGNIIGAETTEKSQ